MDGVQSDGTGKELIDNLIDSARKGNGVAFFGETFGRSRSVITALESRGFKTYKINVDRDGGSNGIRSELAARSGSHALPSIWIFGKYFGNGNDVLRSLSDGSFPTDGLRKVASLSKSPEESAKNVSLPMFKGPKPSVEEFMALSDEQRSMLSKVLSKSNLKKLERRARSLLRKQAATALRKASQTEAEAVRKGVMQRAAAGLAPGGTACVVEHEAATKAAEEAASALAKLEERFSVPARVELIKSQSGPLLGQDKWLGGMASPCGRYVYGVPGGARRVLQVEVATGIIREIGPSFPGQFKWLRGVDVPASVMGEQEYPSGACFALPSNASSVLKVNPETEEVTTFGGPFEGDWLWHGGALAQDGCIYAIPCNAQHVLKINARTEEVTMIGGPWPERQKWYGGILGANGCIYGIPQSAAHVLKINPVTQECTLLPPQLPAGKWLWHGGTHTSDRRYIYAFPNHADQVLKIDTLTDEISLIGGPDVIKSGRHRVPQDGRYKYLGGAYVPMNNCAYCFPCDAERVLKIDCSTDEVSVIGRELLQAPGTSWNGMNKWQNGFFSFRDQCVYAVPQRADGVLRVIPATEENGLVEDYVDLLDCGDECRSFKEKFEGGVMSHQGDIYCIPLRAKHLLKVIPAIPKSKETS